jgi:hypothetical protein
MKLIGIVAVAALLTAAPFSMPCTPKKAGLYVDTANAREVHRRRTHPAAPYFGAAAYPRISYGYPPAYYGVSPYGLPAPYGIPPNPYSARPPTGGFFMGSR